MKRRAAFSFLIFLNLVPIWAVSTLPMGDLGGHIELMDIALRFDSPETLYSEYYRLPSSWFLPNALSLVLARWLGPLFGVEGVVRLLLSAYVIGLPLSLAELADATGRSRWLGLFGCALTYNALVNVGFLNFLIGLPLMLLATATAIRFGKRPSFTTGAWLVALLLTLFTAHAMLFMIATGIAIAILLVYARRPHDLWNLLLVVPGIVALSGWLSELLGEQTRRLPLLTDEGLGLTFDSVSTRLLRVHVWGLSYFRDFSDNVFALVVLGIWVLLLLWTRRGAGTSDSRHSHKSMLLWLRNNVSTWIALAFAISYFVLPSHMRFVSVIAERLVVPTFLFAALIPRCDRLDRRQSLSLGALALLIVAYSANVTLQFRRFERDVVGNLRAGIAALPERSHLGYAMMRTDNPVTFMGPTWHLAKAFHSLENGGITDDSFAANQANPIGYRQGMRPPKLRRGLQHGFYDYLLTFAETNADAPRAAHAPKRLVFEDEQWKLYRVQGLDSPE
jgi:hypothetical protein